MGTVCPSPLLGGLVDLDVLDDQVTGVKTLGVGVGLGVLEEAEEELGGLGGPAGLGDTELLACWISRQYLLKLVQFKPNATFGCHLSLLLRCS